MKNTVTQSEFTAAFHRQNRGDQFTHRGLLALYDYLTDLENDTGVETELDVIGLCCDFVQYDSIQDLQRDYNHIESLEQLRDFTTVILLDNDALIIQAF